MRGRLIANRYELVREIGKGGMGAVWEAFDRVLRRAVALKLIRSEHTSIADVRRRFEREATALAQVQNPHIVSIYDYGIDNGCPYIVMELLAGEDLHARLQREGRQSPAAVLDILQQIASGLTAAAAVAIVHRDLKPANIFFARGDSGETVKILDFGVAWSRSELAKGQPQFAGTPTYMSPEQIRGITPHHVGDLWSAGVIAYKALTDQLPYTQKTLDELVVAICTDEFTPASSIVPELPPGIDQFFARALAKDTAQRFQTAGELVHCFATLCDRPSGAKILVVDDESDVWELMKIRFRRQLRDSIYQFVFAGDGEQAVEQLRRHPDIDIVLADIKMPVMNGLTLLERIPELCPFAKTVMVSAYGDMPNIRRAMNAGAFDFVIKPIDFQDLQTTIDKACREVSGQRTTASADAENRLLRKFASAPVVERLGAALSTGGFASETFDGTVIFVEMAASRDAADHDPSRARAANANFEVIVPEIQARGGLVTSVSGTGVMAVYTGPDHLNRAIEASLAVRAQRQALASVAGSGSAYAQGLRMSVETGEMSFDCVGSRVCGRLAYTVMGEVVDNAARLVRLAQPNEILIGSAAARSTTQPHSYEAARAEALEGVGVHKLSCDREVEEQSLSNDMGVTKSEVHGNDNGDASTLSLPERDHISVGNNANTPSTWPPPYHWRPNSAADTELGEG